MPTRDIYGKYGPINDMEEAERIEQMKKEQGQLTAAPVATATPAATQTQTAAPPTATEQPARRSTADILSYLQGEIDKRTESDEDRKKREKREKTQAVIAGIADIGSAIGNMVHAYHGGKNTFDPTQGMSQKYKELWAEREKMAAERMNYMRMKDSLERQKAAEEASASALAQKQANWQKEYDLKAKEQAEKSQARAEYNQARINQLEAKQEGDTQKVAYWEAKEREALAKEAGEHERAAYWRAKANDIANGTITTTTKTDTYGRSETTVTEKKPSGKKSSGSGNKTEQSKTSNANRSNWTKGSTGESLY